MKRLTINLPDDVDTVKVIVQTEIGKGTKIIDMTDNLNIHVAYLGMGKWEDAFIDPSDFTMAIMDMAKNKPAEELDVIAKDLKKRINENKNIHADKELDNMIDNFIKRFEEEESIK